MTKNQVEYLTMEEQKRSNLVNEGIKRDTLVEQGRHNLVTERQTDVVNAETGRHNLIAEAQGAAANKEVARSHKANEKISRGSLKETVRHNKVAEKQASKDTKTRKEVANISANAQRYSADSSASASRFGASVGFEAAKYNADTTRQTNLDLKKIDADIAKKNRVNSKQIAEIKQATDVYKADIDRFLGLKNLSQTQKRDLRNWKKQIADIKLTKRGQNIKKAEIALNTLTKIGDSLSRMGSSLLKGGLIASK